MEQLQIVEEIEIDDGTSSDLAPIPKKIFFPKNFPNFFENFGNFLKIVA